VCTDTHVHISDPPGFSLVKFLFDQGFDKETVHTAAIADINERLIQEEARITAVETSLLAQAHDALTKLTKLLPATAKLADVFVARNRSKFSNARNHARQAACQVALCALPKPPKKARPTAEARSILQAFWDAGGTTPNVDERLMLACHAHLTFNQVRFRIGPLFPSSHRSTGLVFLLECPHQGHVCVHIYRRRIDVLVVGEHCHGTKAHARAAKETAPRDSRHQRPDARALVARSAADCADFAGRCERRDFVVVVGVGVGVGCQAEPGGQCAG